MEAPMFKKILVPIDLAEPGMMQPAIDHAVALAKACDSELRLINVQSLIPVAFLDYVPEDFDRDIRSGIERELATIAAKLDYPPGRVSSAVLFGPVYHKILGEADDWRADLIVLCPHRPSMARFLIGSNASAILRHAKCSVLVVRSSAPQ
jgi:universal stress protein F